MSTPNHVLKEKYFVALKEIELLYADLVFLADGLRHHPEQFVDATTNHPLLELVLTEVGHNARLLSRKCYRVKSTILTDTPLTPKTANEIEFLTSKLQKDATGNS